MATATAKADRAAKPEPLLDIRNLRIEATVYPPGEDPKQITLVHDVSLTLKRGKVLGLIGESGAGKSTIGLSSMAYGRGGVRITGGEVVLNGRDVLERLGADTLLAGTRPRGGALFVFEGDGHIGIDILQITEVSVGI